MMGSLIGGLIQQAGGVGGLLDMLRKGGLGQQADSWQGTGQNLPIDPAELMRVLGGGGAGGGAMGGLLGQVLGGGAAGGAQPASGGMGGLLGQVLGGGGAAAPSAGGSLGDVFAQAGIGHDQLGGLLAQVLPQVLDGMTPTGQAPAEHSGDMLQGVLGNVLKGALGGGGGATGRGGLFG